jgi:hypothetical protein
VVVLKDSKEIHINTARLNSECYSILFVNMLKFLLYLLISLFLLAGQFSDRNTAAFSLSLSCSSSLQSNNVVYCLFSAFARTHWAF